MNKTRKNNLTIIEKTHAKFYCLVATCPAIFETNRGTYIIVGKKLKLNEVSQKVRNKIGDGEISVEIPKGLLDELSK